MEFKLEDFVVRPTREALHKCKKDDLRLIAGFFHVQVPGNINIKELKELLCARLGERSLFDESVPAEGVELGATAGVPFTLSREIRGGSYWEHLLPVVLPSRTQVTSK